MFNILSPEVFWFVLGFLLLLAELAIPVFVALFFGIGAWATALLVFVGMAPDINFQIIIFTLVSVISFILFRRKGLALIKKSTQETPQEANALGSMIGSHGTVIADIAPNDFSGRVELNGTLWNAIADVAIEKGLEVEVIEQNNLTVKVKPLKEEQK